LVKKYKISGKLQNFTKFVLSEFANISINTVRFFKLESITFRGKKKFKNFTFCPAIIRPAIEKRLALSKTRSNLEKI
jgi:hypothetical protein